MEKANVTKIDGFYTLILLLTLFASFAPIDAKAQNIGPAGIHNIIKEVIIENGQLVAIDRQGNQIPLDLTSTGVGGGSCSILNLALGPINLDLLGLLVDISPICLEINAYPGQGLLGSLLCGIANLLDQGIDLPAILQGLTANEQRRLTRALTQIINRALNNLNDAIVTAIHDGGAGCTILDLSLGPLDLRLLGLQVYLHDCDDGPVTVTVAADPTGGLLGQLLCGLLGPLDFELGDTLRDVLRIIFRAARRLNI